ncbi:MAG: hypothetical protein QGH70_08395, partial [Nitrospinota bacterium]|nr:hypothetical protein [Nitrospinota bacterium]
GDHLEDLRLRPMQQRSGPEAERGRADLASRKQKSFIHRLHRFRRFFKFAESKKDLNLLFFSF